METLSRRQLRIFEFIRTTGGASNQELLNHLQEGSRTTIVRDLDVLLRKGLIQKIGRGRSVRYEERVEDEILRYIDVEAYFEKGPDERKPIFERLRFEVFDHLQHIFRAEELKTLHGLNADYQKRIKALSPAILRKELERLTIELSWKSSRIEGNTYSLLDTEVLIKEHKEAAGHSREEALMILNHKNALEYILNKRSDFQHLTLPKIGSIHDLIIKDLGVARGLRKKPVGVVGTRYKPLDNEHQIREAMEKTVAIINKTIDPFSKAILGILLLSYIQPFEDGNKRTARLLGSALLLAYDACPLSFRSVDEADYKKALLLFYEQNSIRFFKELFVEQFIFALENYFRGTF